MKRVFNAIAGLLTAAVLAVGLVPAASDAKIEGITGDTTVVGQPVFNLSAKTGYITLGDGASLFMWGYANEDPTPSFCAAGGCMQYTGPTLIVNQGDIVTINFKNNLTVPSSIVFPGQTGVTSADKAGVLVGGVPGYMTREAKANGGEVTYTFTANEPGTYLYHSGTRPDLQVEMGLIGAIVVRPSGCPLTPKVAYCDTPAYDFEHLFLLTEADPLVHAKVEQGRISEVDTALARPTYWFINGRTLPDTLSGNFSVTLPAQPYGSIVQMHPNDIALYRILNGGRDAHPFHTHGGHHVVIAKNGAVLGPTLNAVNHPQIGLLPSGAYAVYTSGISPGETWEALMTMHFDTLGWDVYGHGPLDALAPGECSTLAGGPADPACPHGRQFNLAANPTSALPIIMPDQNDFTGGQFWSGSPFLGTEGSLPPGEGGFNPNSGFFFMQHSHAEKELTNNNIFPGGMATFLIIENPNVTIPAE